MRASQRSVLASLPVALSEASGPTGIDLDEGQAGLGERPFEQAMIGARGFEDDSADLEPSEPFDEGAMASGIVGDAEALARGQDRDVERVFRNVDADVLC